MAVHQRQLRPLFEQVKRGSSALHAPWSIVCTLTRALRTGGVRVDVNDRYRDELLKRSVNMFSGRFEWGQAPRTVVEGTWYREYAVLPLHCGRRGAQCLCRGHLPRGKYNHVRRPVGADVADPVPGRQPQ
jgi:hypothetical protein